MDEQDNIPRDPTPPITNAFLHREVYPDNVAGTKSEHGGLTKGDMYAPKTDEDLDDGNYHTTDCWMYT